MKDDQKQKMLYYFWWITMTIVTVITTILALYSLTGCTKLSINVIQTQGRTADVVDETSSEQLDLKGEANLNLPLT